jgi:hypothetical protein
VVSNRFAALQAYYLWDWNVNLCQDNPKAFKIQNILERYNLVNRILTPTRLSKTSSSLIDVMITERPNHDITVENIDLGFSDHKVQILYQRLDETVTRVIHKDKRLYTVVHCP